MYLFYDVSFQVIDITVLYWSKISNDSSFLSSFPHLTNDFLQSEALIKDVTGCHISCVLVTLLLHLSMSSKICFKTENKKSNAKSLKLNYNGSKVLMFHFVGCF